MKFNILQFILLCGALLCGIGAAEAVPADPHPARVRQSDGSYITVQTFGDEFYGYTLSEDGYLLRSGDDGDWYYAIRNDKGYIVPSTVRAKDASYRSAADMAAMRSISRNLRPSAVRGMQTRGMANAYRKNLSRKVPTTGEVKNLVILVQFQDVKFSTDDPNTALYNMLNQKDYSHNGGTGSASQYYEENSNGQYIPVFDAVGPVTLSKEERAYGAPDPVTGENDCDPAGMAREAIMLAREQFNVNFSQYSDDGVARSVLIFFAGCNQAELAADWTIWPHQWSLTAGGYDALQYDGVTVDEYACFSELKGDNPSLGIRAPIGTFCHEFAHTLGLPDFYDPRDGEENPDEKRSLTLGEYDLMDQGPYNNNGNTPPSLNAYERIFLGWMEPIVLTQTTECELPAIEEMVAYQINSPTHNEYFLFETRGLSKWDQGMYYSNQGKGMLIYHVDRSANIVTGAIGALSAIQRWSLQYNAVNGVNSHQCFRLILNNGRTEVPTAATAYYPGSSNTTEFTYEGVPRFASWKGESTGFNITDIRFDGTKTTFKAIKVSNDGEIFATPGQYDALLTWNDENNNPESKWVVSWKATTGEETYTKTVTGMATSISPLKPGTTYDVSVYPVEDVSLVSEAQVTTESPTEGAIASFNGIQDTYNATDYIRLSVKNLSQIPASIEWYVDNEEAEDTYLKLSSGEHTIKAVATAGDDSREVLFKYVTVK